VRVGTTAMLNVRFALAVPSVTVAVKVALPAAEGVPEMTPPVLSDSPWGSDPEVTLQEYVPAPPAAESVCEYGVPTVAPAREEVVTFNCGAAIVMLSDWVAVPFELSLTCTVNPAVPGALGVPLIVPPAESDSPVGSEPLLTDQTYPPLPPVAESVCE
jgi:hypothetical protein